MSTRRSLESRKDRIAALAYDYAAQPKQPRSRCNLCGFDRFVTLAHCDRYGYPGGQRDLRAAGCMPAGCLNGQKARVALMVLLGAGMIGLAGVGRKKIFKK